MKEEQTSPTNTIIKSPRKLFSPFSSHSIQTTISSLEIDQTIDEVINGKGDINVSDLPPAPPPAQLQTHPSSQLVWVQNGTVTTKTWLSPLYQKQQQQQQQQQQQLPLSATYDPHGSTLTHQDVVNIAQQVVFPTANEQNKGSTVGGSKRRNRSKSTTTSTAPKRNRNRKHPPSRAHSITANNQDSPTKVTVITPTSNLISKPSVWSQSSTASSSAGLPSMTGDKNDLWPGQGMENVDTMLDEFQLVSIDEQRMHANHQFDFDLSIDGFSSKTSDRFASSTPPPPLAHDHQRYALTAVGEKFPHPFTAHGKLTGGDVDVYEHFLNPLPVSSSSSMWQEDQVTSSVSTPPDFQPNHFPVQQRQQPQQQYYPSVSDEPFDSLHSQVRLLFDVQS